MKSTKIADDTGSEIRVVILDSGEDAFTTLTKFADDAGITAASLTAIGAFEKATIGWFDFDKKTYKKIEIDRKPTRRSRSTNSARS
jgi:predicted DNA-binding protein with PD1-like motif